MDEKLILHSDLNNFYASVECLLKPEYRSLPLAVAGAPERRHGVVLAKNAIAKKAGIKTGDVIWQAKQKCAELVVVAPHYELYTRFSELVFDIYKNYSDFVEPFGPDECWLDCSALARNFDEGAAIAAKIKDDVRTQTGLSVSVGVSFTKPFAKLCSDLAEADAVFVASKDDFEKRLWPLGADKLLNVGKATKERLSVLSIKSIGDLAHADDELLKRFLGVNGLKLKQAALGTDGETVRRADKKRKRESVGHGMTTTKDITDYNELYAVICYLTEKIAARMIEYGVKGYGVHIDLRSSELSHSSKQTKLAYPVFASSDVALTALRLAKELLSSTAFSLRTVTVSVFELAPANEGVQLSMLESRDERSERLELAVNSIRRKYGKNAVMRANLFGQDFIYDKTDDEDFLPFKR